MAVASFMPVSASRCPLCAATAVGPSPLPSFVQCEWCGLHIVPARHREVSRDLAAAVDAQEVVPPGEADWFADAVTWRIAQTRSCHWFVPEDPAALVGHTLAPPEGQSQPLLEALPKDVTLAVLSREGDPRLDRLLNWAESWFGKIVVALDSERAPARHEGKTTWLHHPLEDDFGAQRNRLQSAATTPWVLHLDTDESLPDHLTSRLGDLGRTAGTAGLRALGFRRRNLVDGMQRNLYPDVQYRFLRREVRFVGRVHERPDACAHWPSTLLCLLGDIDHHLDAEHVQARRIRYDAMGQSPERAVEADALAQPYDCPANSA
jgi:hypothetical protein